MYHPTSEQKRMADAFKGLSDRTRVAMLEWLRSCCAVVSMDEETHEVRAEQVTSTFSRHCKEQHEAGLITLERRGKHVVCCINPDGGRRRPPGRGPRPHRARERRLLLPAPLLPGGGAGARRRRGPCGRRVNSPCIPPHCPPARRLLREGVGFSREDCGCHYVKPFDVERSVSFLWTREHTPDGNKKKLRGLPREIRVEVEGKRALFCRGSPRSTTEYLFENRSDGFLRQFTPGSKDDAEADVIVFGHTHVPYLRAVDGVSFVNTGSVGRAKDGDPRRLLRAHRRRGRRRDGRTGAARLRRGGRLLPACRSGPPPCFSDYLRTGGNVAAAAG